jgi:hypothetical protein
MCGDRSRAPFSKELASFSPSDDLRDALLSKGRHIAMITFKSIDDQRNFINKMMKNLLHHRFAENVITCNTSDFRCDPYVYRNFSECGIFVTAEATSCGMNIRLTIGTNIVLHRSFMLIEADALDVVTRVFIDFCLRAKAISAVLSAPEGETR